MMTRPFDNRYSIEVDQVTEGNWDDLLQLFNDATIYQTWAYGVAHWGENRLSHLVLRKDGEIVGLAQLAIVKLPVVRAGIAYIFWGPVWKRKGTEISLENFRHMINALGKEYVQHRRLNLRILPNEIEDGDETIRSAFAGEGFHWKPNPYRTILLDLSPSLEDLRKGLGRRWRHQLNRAEKNGLNLDGGISTTLFDKFSMIYEQMLSRKKFEPFVDINEFRRTQDTLPDIVKMRILMCQHENKPASGLICSAIGDRGVYLLGATSNDGMRTRGSYLLHWEIIKWLKEEKGCRYYDLGGIDPETNPGVYVFKSGLGGKEVKSIGKFEACDNRMSAILVACGDKVRSAWRKTKVSVKRKEIKFREMVKPNRGEDSAGENPVC